MKKYFNLAAGATMLVGTVAALADAVLACRGIDANVCKNPVPSLVFTAPGIFFLMMIGGAGLVKFRDSYCEIRYPEEYLPKPVVETPPVEGPVKPAEEKPVEAPQSAEVQQPPAPPQP